LRILKIYFPTTTNSVNGQRGQATGGFKANRLERMYQNELSWLTNNFGKGSITTDEFSQHDRRIFQHWMNKMDKNKQRMLTRLYRCGGEFDPALIEAAASSGGGFSEFDEQKLKEAEQVKVNATEGDADGDATSVGAGREIIGQPTRGRRRRAVKDYDQAEVDETLKNLDFDYDYPDIETDQRVRSRGPQGQEILRYEGKKSLGRIRMVLQGFAMWAKNHISECEPNQPEKQMSRASKWFLVLAKKIVGKGKHVIDAQRRGLRLVRNT